MQKITTHLWYDKEAKEAAGLYVSIFGRYSKVLSTARLEDTPSGSVDIVTFQIFGREFQAISAGPLFSFNPSVSFHVVCRTKDEVDLLWRKLSEGGTVLMELGAYPFSERYGWVQDRYGLSWQLIYFSGQNENPKITPVLMFVGDVAGKAEEAVDFWTSVFRDSKKDKIFHYGKGEDPEKEGSTIYAEFSLLGQEFGAMDSAQTHRFTFNEAISFVVYCDTQEEIDYYWEKLSAVPESEQCGWLKDRYGFSWQIVPAVLEEMMKTADKAQLGRVTRAFLQMKKFDLAALQKAFAG